MPLNVSGLQSALESIFSNPPTGSAACANAWGDAMQTFASGVVPASTTVSAAVAALKTALATAFGSPAAAPGMETAFATFATTIAGGMAPAFVGTPPPSPVGFAAQFAAPHPATHAIAAATYATKINVWMKTGTATPSGGGAPILWT